MSNETEILKYISLSPIDLSTSLPLSETKIPHLEEKRPRHSVMGSSISRAHYRPPSSRVSAQTQSVGPAMAEKKKEEKNEKVDYMNLPCPVPYCLLQDEAWREHFISF